MKTTYGLLLQFAITEVAVAVFGGLIGGLKGFLAGFVAPMIGLQIPFAILISPNDPFYSQIFPLVFIFPTLLIILIFSAYNKIHKLFGHLALFLFNLLSVIIVMGSA